MGTEFSLWNTEFFLLGLAGGIATEALKWFHVREELHKGIPDYAKSWPYWSITAIMVFMGGGLVLVYLASEGVDLNPILAVNIGASAPLILGALSGQVVRIDHEPVD